MDEDENDEEYMSEYEKSWVPCARLGWEDLILAILHSRSGHVHAILGMVH